MPQAAESSAMTRSIREGEGDGGAAPGIVKGGFEASRGELEAHRLRERPQRLGPVGDEGGDPEPRGHQRCRRLRLSLGPGRVEKGFAGRQGIRHQGGEAGGIAPAARASAAVRAPTAKTGRPRRGGASRISGTALPLVRSRAAKGPAGGAAAVGRTARTGATSGAWPCAARAAPVRVAPGSGRATQMRTG